MVEAEAARKGPRSALAGIRERPAGAGVSDALPCRGSLSSRGPTSSGEFLLGWLIPPLEIRSPRVSTPPDLQRLSMATGRVSVLTAQRYYPARAIVAVLGFVCPPDFHTQLLPTAGLRNVGLSMAVAVRFRYHDESCVIASQRQHHIVSAAVHRMPHSAEATSLRTPRAR